MGQVCSQELGAILPDGPYPGAKTGTPIRPDLTTGHLYVEPLRTLDTPAHLLSQSAILDQNLMHTDRRNSPHHHIDFQQPVVVSRIQQPIAPPRQRVRYDPKFYESLLEDGTLTEFIYEEDLERLSEGCEYRQAQLSPNQQYMGEWKANKPHGKGVLTTPEEKYIGWFKEGRKHQRGRQILADEVYEGTYTLGKRTNEGRRYTPTRQEVGVFDGELIRGRIRYLDSSSTYQGNLVNGLRESKQSTFVWSDFTTYVGSFKNDMINGTGILTYPDGRTYSGEFYNEAKHGKGTFTWPATGTQQARSYTGEYYNNMRQGNGLYVWKWLNVGPERKRQYFYEGEFWNDLPHGKGIVQDEKGLRSAEFVYGREITEYQ